MQPMPFKVKFLIQLIRRLHQTGTGANRLEDAITHVGRGLDLEVDLFTSPTSVIVSIRDEKDRDDSYRVPTQVLRLPPGDVDLGKLCLVNEIADRVVDGRLSLHKGYNLLKNLPTAYGSYDRMLQLGAFTLASAAVSVMFRAGIYDCLISLVTGFIIGLLALWLGGIKRIAGNFEALAALVVSFCAWAGTVILPGISPHIIILAGLISLFPGLSLTTAVAELSTYHLMSGTSRFAGSVMSLMKLGFGVFLGTELTGFLPGLVKEGAQASMPDYSLWIAVPVSALAFAIMFRVRRQEMLVAVTAAILGYLAAKTASGFLSQGFGIFLAGLVMAAGANLFAHATLKPSSIVRVPGIILLVPGSVGYTAITYFLEKNVASSLEATFGVVVVLASLVGGLLFGNMLIPPRRSL